MRLPLALLILFSLAGPVASADRLDLPREHVEIPFTDCNVNNDHAATEIEVACIDETGFGFALRQGPHTDELAGETGYCVVAGTYEGGQRSAQVLCADVAINSERCYGPFVYQYAEGTPPSSGRSGAVLCSERVGETVCFFAILEQQGADTVVPDKTTLCTDLVP